VSRFARNHPTFKTSIQIGRVEATVELRQSCSGRIHNARFGTVSPAVRTRTIAITPCQTARLADQRPRLLSGYALEGPARHRRGRAAALFAGRLEGMPIYFERERAALTWTEAVTLITNGHVPDGVYEQSVRTSAKRNCLTSPSRWPPSIREIVCRLPDAPHGERIG